MDKYSAHMIRTATQQGLSGAIDLSIGDVETVIDELGYQLHYALKKAGRVEIPNLGTLEIVHDESGDWCRLVMP